MKHISTLLAPIFILLAAACQPGEKMTTIGYLQITEDPVLDAAKKGVFQALADSGFVDGQNIKVLDKNAQGDLSMINTILQMFQSQKVDLVITSSTPCMTAAAQTIKNIPVVFTVSFSPDQMGLKNPPPTLTGVTDQLKVKEIVDLMMECIPDLKRVGFPYNTSEPNAEYSAKILDIELKSRGIEVIHAAVNSTNDILQAAQSLAGKKIDAFLIAADNTVYLGLGVIARIAAEKKIPIFVTDPLQVEKGAAIGFGINYYDWGYLSGQKAVKVLRGVRPQDTPIETIGQYELIINQAACDAQGLVVPETVLARAARIIK
jgi:putative ABC transport system substrate-binding protein